MFFDHLDERNTMVRFISYFDNFTKWIILVVNNHIQVVAAAASKLSSTHAAGNNTQVYKDK